MTVDYTNAGAPLPAPATPQVEPAGPVPTPFFAVSQNKLLVMSVCTITIYQFYWFYKQWQAIKARTGEDIRPFWRTVFGIFYCHSLFNRVRTFNPDSPAAGLQASMLATAWVILVLLGNVRDPYWLVSLACVIPTLPVQGAINELNRATVPDHDPNDRFSAWNWVGMALGGLALLVIVGSFVGK